MSRKQKALKALAVLAVVIALCMFFSRTIQTITTPKIQRITATKGKLEQKIPLTGDIYFSKTVSYKVEDAKKLAITIDQVMVRAGYHVEKGDVLFTAYAPEYESKMKTLKDSYDGKVAEMAAEYAAHVRIQQSSDQNIAYNTLLSAMDTYYTARYQLVVAAMTAGYTLPGDEAAWNAVTDAPESMAEALKAFIAAETAKTDASTKLRQLYKSGVGRVGDETFEYIKKIDGFKKEIAKFEDQMLELDLLNRSLTSVTAPQSGYITEISLKEGDSYDGSKTAYIMNAEDTSPSLRADISSVTKTLSKGNKVELTDSSVSTEVESVETGTDGKKYAVIQLDSDLIKSAGGMSKLIAGSIPLTITYKAQKSATLLPASAVRSESGGGYYIYVVDRTYGGILDSSGYKITKTTVTVLEKTDQVVAVSDDLAYAEIADREDRALTDGQAVMDYVD